MLKCFYIDRSYIYYQWETHYSRGPLCLSPLHLLPVPVGDTLFPSALISTMRGTICSHLLYVYILVFLIPLPRQRQRVCA